MLHDRVILMQSLHGVELAGLLFFEYLDSGVYRGDMAESLCNIGAVISVFKRGFSFYPLASIYARSLGERLLYRLTECCVMAACTKGCTFFKDAVVLHYTFPIVQEYRFSRAWMTRLLRAVGRAVYPSMLRNVVVGNSVCPVDPNPVRSYTSDAPPPATGGNAFEGMPAGCQDALQFYRYSFEESPVYSVLASCFVADITNFLWEQSIWAAVFLQERKRPTSAWRLMKPYCASMTMNAVQVIGSYAARIAGTLIGRAVSSEPTGGGIFWWQHGVLLAMSPIIAHISVLAGSYVQERLERAHPATAEDEIQAQREEEEAENIAGDHRGPGTAASAEHAKGVDFYEVLGLSQKASDTDIKKAYRTLALKNHPDRVGNDSEAQARAREHMAMINEAYDTLIHENKRSQYDTSRMFSEAPDFFKRVDEMSTPWILVVGTSSIVGLTTASGVLLYAQYCSIFQKVTAPGRGPLCFFG